MLAYKKLTIIAIAIIMLTRGMANAQNTNDTTITINKGLLKLIDFVELLENEYMEKIDEREIVDFTIQSMLASKDPHTKYLSKSEAAEERAKNKPQSIGMGLTCKIYNDTTTIVAVEPYSPAYHAGLKPGTRIDSIGNKDVTGRRLSQADIDKIMESQSGDSTYIVAFAKKGTRKIKVGINQKSNGGIESNYSPNDTTIYIRLTSFNSETEEEFAKVMASYGKRKHRNIILDLRDNTGGIYKVTKTICNYFLKDNCLISNRVHKETNNPVFTDYNGPYINSRLYILINEKTGSSSEVVASCLQDWDRAAIIGRRSFGKAMSQHIQYLSDSSMVKITNNMLYSPSGRCIQKDYSMQASDYFNETAMRKISGENVMASKMPKQKDTVQYRTVNRKRPVPAGIGVVPDVFVAEDTTSIPKQCQTWFCNGIWQDFVYFYIAQHHASIKKQYPNYNTFTLNFRITAQISQMYEQYCQINKRDSEISQNIKYLYGSQANPKVQAQASAIMAKSIFGTNDYRKYINRTDPDFNAAMFLINNPEEYYKIFQPKQ